MKKLRVIIIFPLLAALLTACADSAGTGDADISELLVVQVVGIDDADSAARVSVSTARSGESKRKTALAASGGSATLAIEKLRGLAGDGELLLADADYVLIGENAAKNTQRCLDFIERSVELRMSASVLTVRGGDAETLVTRSGGEDGDITAILASLSHDAISRGLHIFDCGEIALSLARDGAALAGCVRAETDSSSGEDILTAVFDSYAVLRDGVTAAYITGDAVYGVSILRGDGISVPVMVDGVTLTLTGGSAKLHPVWADDGRLTGLDVAVSVRAEITETDGEGSVTDDAALAAFSDGLAADVGGWVSDVLNASKKLGADFLGLGREIELMAPKKWRSMPVSWSETLPELEINVTAEATVTRSMFLDDPAGTEGEM